jgi:FADH2-dependent halogenase
MFDVAIIGGGPAGSAAATFLAQKGRSVVVLEREKFPRFHIGESLLPFSMTAFERLGVMPKLEAAGFIPKYGAEIASADGGRDTRFYFKDGFRSQRATAFQVTRADFDKILLDHAAESGAEVREETSVERLEFHRDHVELGVRPAGGEAETVRARYLLDCSGRHTLVGAHFDLKRSYPSLRKFAIYAHYEGVETPCGIDGTLTRMVRADDHWFWMIPLTPERTSIGVVMDTARFKQFDDKPDAVLQRLITASPVMNHRMREAARTTKVYATGDYSYRNRRIHGDRWLLCGDAAGFIDPVFSSGVFLATYGAEQAAEALESALANPARRRAAFRQYSSRLGAVMKFYLRFVEGWYRREFMETLLNPREFFEVVPAVNAMLAGNLGGSFALRWRLWLFLGIVALQRWFPISPRLSDESEPALAS